MLSVLQDWLDSLRLQIGGVAGSYAMLVNVYLLLHFTIGERWAVIAFLNNAAHWITFGAVLSFFAALVSPYRRFWVAYAVPGVIAFIAWYGILFLPKTTPRAHGSELAISVATFNMTNGRDYPDEKRAVIRELGVDLIGIQEAAWEDFFEPLRDQYPYFYAERGLALLSRYPFDVRETYLIGDLPGRNNPVALRTIVTIDGQALSVYIMHPKRPTITVRPLLYDGLEREIGVQDALAAIEREENPVIILCDCNMGYKSEDYRPLAKVLTDAWRERGFGFGLTAPAEQDDTPLKLLRSDIIWHSDAITTQAVAVWPRSGGADHRPVHADLLIERSE